MASFGAADWLRFASRLASFGAADWLRFALRLASFRAEIGFVRRGEIGFVAVVWIRFAASRLGPAASGMVRLRGLDTPYKQDIVLPFYHA